MLDKKTT